MDSVGEGGGDDGSWIEGIRVGIELVVECCGAEDERWKEGREFWSG